MKKRVTKKQQVQNQDFVEEGYYVYALIDPRNNEIFYIGKGQGLRATQHEQEVAKNSILQEKNDDTVVERAKTERINAIRKAGKNVEIYLLRHGLNSSIFKGKTNKEEVVAYELEAMMIDFIHHMQEKKFQLPQENKNGLTNIQNGHGQRVRGGISFEDFQNNRLADIKAEDGIIIVVNINDSYERKGDAYEAAKQSWEIRQQIREKAKYVLAIYQSEIVGIFIPKKWEEVETITKKRTRHLYGFEKYDIDELSKKERDDYENFVKRVLHKHLPWGARINRSYINDPRNNSNK